MKRREFVTLVGGAAAWPLVVQAQKQVPVIAILASGAAEARSSIFQMQLFNAGMSEIGLVEGRSDQIPRRSEMSRCCS